MWGEGTLISFILESFLFCLCLGACGRVPPWTSVLAKSRQPSETDPLEAPLPQGSVQTENAGQSTPLGCGCGNGLSSQLLTQPHTLQPRALTWLVATATWVAEGAGQHRASLKRLSLCTKTQVFVKQAVITFQGEASS